jgi:hypothetical protein
MEFGIPAVQVQPSPADKTAERRGKLIWIARVNDSESAQVNWQGHTQTMSSQYLHMPETQVTKASVWPVITFCSNPDKFCSQ